MSRSKAGIAGALLLSLLSLAGCGGGSSGGSYGSLKVGIADKVSPSYSAVYITVKEVRVVPTNYNQNAADTDSNLPVIAKYPDGLQINVMDFQYVQKALGEATIPAGQYSQVRLILAANPSQAPYANYLTTTTGSTVALDTPSGQTSGLKILGNFEVEAGKINAIVLDFDPSTAVVKRGNSGQYNIKPTGIRIIQTPEVLNSFASLVGTVQSSTPWSSATLSLLDSNRSPVAAGVFHSYTTAGTWQGTFSAYVPGADSYRMYIKSPEFQTYSATVAVPAAGSTKDLGIITR